MQQGIGEFLGPIFAKEVIEIARRWRYYLCRTAYGATLVLIMFVAWEETQNLAARMGVGNTLARIAGAVFLAASHVQYWSVYLLVPAFLCGVIAGEREEHTLDLLFITPLSDREIVLGKLASRVAAMVCLILCGVPVVSLLMMFGGIGPDSIWRVLAATLLAIVFVGSHAIYFSVVTKAPMEALARTYAAMFMWLAGLAILAWAYREFLQATQFTIPTEIEDYLVYIYLAYPLASFWAAVNETDYTRITLLYGSWAWPASFITPALVSVFLLRRAVRRLRETPAPRLSWARWLRWGKRQKREPNPVRVAAQRRRAGRWGGISIENPLWLRARLTPVYDRAGAIGRLQWLGWIIVVLALAVMAIFKESYQGYNIAFEAPTWVVLMLVTSLVAGHSVIGDRRRGFLEQVIVTPLTGREIVDGTFLALVEHLRRLWWLPVTVCVFFWMFGSTSGLGTFLSAGSATLFCLALMWQGMACSLAARTTPGAVVSAFILPVTAIFLLPFVTMLFRQDHAYALWNGVGASMIVTGIWMWKRLNAASVGCFWTAVHLGLTALAVSWAYEDRPDCQLPETGMHPIFLIVAPLVRDEMRQLGQDDPWSRHWVQLILCYWMALGLHMALLRLWLARQFDRLVERMGTRSMTHGKARMTKE